MEFANASFTINDSVALMEFAYPTCRSDSDGLLSGRASSAAFGRLQRQPEGTLRADCAGECAHQWGGQAFRWVLCCLWIAPQPQQNKKMQQLQLKHGTYKVCISHCPRSVCLFLLVKCRRPLKVCNTAKSSQGAGAWVVGSEGTGWLTEHSLLFKHHFTFKKSFKYLHSLLNRFSFL